MLFTFFAFAGTTVASLPATSVTNSGATADAGAVQPSPNTSSRALSPSILPGGKAMCVCILTPDLVVRSALRRAFVRRKSERLTFLHPFRMLTTVQQFSLAVNAQIFAGVTGSVFNPAIALGLALIGAHTPIRALILTVAEMLGSIAGAAITSALLPGYVGTARSVNGTIPLSSDWRADPSTCERHSSRALPSRAASSSRCS